MFEQVINALAPYPVAQVFLILVIAFLGYMASRRADKDRKHVGGQSVEVPFWLMSGPVHDAIGAIHDIAEEMRTQNAILRDIDKAVSDFNRGQEHTHRLLEAIRNDLEMKP